MKTTLVVLVCLFAAVVVQAEHEQQAPQVHEHEQHEDSHDEEHDHGEPLEADDMALPPGVFGTEGLTKRAAEPLAEHSYTYHGIRHSPSHYPYTYAHYYPHSIHAHHKRAVHLEPQPHYVHPHYYRGYPTYYRYPHYRGYYSG